MNLIYILSAALFMACAQEPQRPPMPANLPPPTKTLPTPAQLAAMRPLTAAQYQTQKNKCAGSGCCLSSLETIYKNKFMLIEAQGTCPPELQRDMLRCMETLIWCAPPNTPVR